MEIRVQKLIAQAGIAARRKAEELIRQGRVLVNNKKIILGTKADPIKDQIRVDGELLTLQQKLCMMVFKPKGVLSTTYDEWGRTTVLDLVNVKEKLFIVGRLDKDAEGLIILTNDGDLANKVMHPRYEVTKTYEVVLDSPFSKNDESLLRRGIIIDERTVRIHQCEILTSTLVRISLHEGRKHIVKRLFEQLGYGVINLRRTKIGKLRLSGLLPGESQRLSLKEIELLSSP